jgi:hypothetical protein
MHTSENIDMPRRRSITGRSWFKMHESKFPAEKYNFLETRCECEPKDDLLRYQNIKKVAKHVYDFFAKKLSFLLF